MNTSAKTPLIGSTITQDDHVQATAAKRERRQKVIQSLVLYSGFFSLGLTSIVGPTLLELQRNTNTTLQTISFVFPLRSIFGLVGAVLAGFMTDQLNHWMLLSLMIGACGGLCIAMPLITHITLLMTIFSASGLCGFFFNAGGNMVLLKVWGENNGPWMQALHFVCGLGAFFGPLLAEPFLPAHHSNDNSDLIVGLNSTSIKYDNGIYSGVTYQELSGLLQHCSNTSTIPSTAVTTTLATDNMTIVWTNASANPMEQESCIHWAYLIVGMISISSAVAFLFVMFYCSETSELRLHNKHNKTTQSVKKVEAEEESEDRSFRVLMIVLVFFFYFMYCMLEICYGNYLAAYAVKGLGRSEQEGARVSVVYWSSFMVGRALGIFIVQVIPPWAILTGDLLIGVVSLFFLCLFSHTHRLILWVCTATLGLGISNMFATGITWAEQYIKLTGTAGAVFVIGGAGGEIVGPIIIGALFTTVGPQSFIYIMFAAASCLGILLAMMLFMGYRHGKRKYATSTSKDIALQETDTLSP